MHAFSAPVAAIRLAVAAALLSTPGIADPVLLPGQAAAVSAQTAPVSAPYQIDGYERPPGHGMDAAASLVVVGLGRAPDLGSPEAGGAIPASGDLEWMTLLGTSGSVFASRVKVERRCEYLCSLDGPEECHWVGLYAPHGLEDVGEIVAALPGRLDLSEFTPLDPHDAATDPMASLAVADSSAGLLWSGYGAGMKFQATKWDLASGRLTGSLGSPHGDAESLEADDCRATAYEWLLAIDCGEFAVLASGGHPLLVSLGDYNSPAVEAVARFEHGGSRHYVVRFGAKAQDVVGLVSAEPAGWHARFRPRDWAQLC
ncbi:MAG: hypothetical protein ACODAA_00250 [Gemmatimonadota bacterium]